MIVVMQSNQIEEMKSTFWRAENRSTEKLLRREEENREPIVTEFRGGLKKLVADMALDNDILREAASGNV